MCIYQYIDREWGTVGVRFFHWCCFKISSICQRCCCKISSICIPQNFIQLGSQETKHNAHAQREAKQRYQRFYVIATLPLWMNKITPLISDALRWYIHTVLYLYTYIYRYVLWKNCWPQVLCVYDTYPSLHIRQQEITRTYKDMKANPPNSWDNSVW